MKLNLLLGLLGALGAAAPAFAHTSIYASNLFGASENPPTPSGGFGTAIVTVDADSLTMRVQAIFAGLSSNVTIAHIHCCTNPPGNVGVATPTPTFPGFPAGVTTGTYDQTFDLALASSYNPAFITANGNTVGGAMNALMNGLSSGRAYFNIHTSLFQGGEIRGFLQPVPEPGTYAMLLAGLGVLGFIAKRRATRVG